MRTQGARAIAVHIASKANVEERWFGSPGQPDRASIEGLLDSVLPSTVEAFRGLLHHSFYAPLLGVLVRLRYRINPIINSIINPIQLTLVDASQEPDVNTIREYALETRGALVTLNSILARSQYLAAGTQRPSFVDLVAYHELLQLRLLPSMDLTPYQHVKRWQEQLRGDASLQTCAFDAPLAEYASSLAAMFQALEGEGEEHTTADDYDHDGSGHSGHCCSREHEASK